MKDRFSRHSGAYAQFRPGYPEDLVRLIVALVSQRQNAWDCATGNGQMAVQLAAHFNAVYATDISKAQMLHAPPMPNILYRQEAAEQSSFPDQYFDLITVAQAIHWFRFDAFYQEVYRTLKPEGLLAVVGYGLLQVSEAVDSVLYRLYRDIVGPYWDPERQYIDAAYQTIPFPFEELEVPAYTSRYHWTFEQLIGYLNTWSAVQRYVDAKGQNPVELIEAEMKQLWGDGQQPVNFPLLVRIGRKRAHI